MEKTEIFTEETRIDLYNVFDKVVKDFKRGRDISIIFTERDELKDKDDILEYCLYNEIIDLKNLINHTHLYNDKSIYITIYISEFITYIHKSTDNQNLFKNVNTFLKKHKPKKINVNNQIKESLEKSVDLDTLLQKSLANIKSCELSEVGIYKERFYVITKIIQLLYFISNSKDYDNFVDETQYFFNESVF